MGNWKNDVEYLKNLRYVPEWQQHVGVAVTRDGHEKACFVGPEMLREARERNLLHMEHGTVMLEHVDECGLSVSTLADVVEEGSPYEKSENLLDLPVVEK